ncbi:hypothetical protein [Streptomyces sp. AC495_CC817]|uniref:hypothetical protein n=1 Tax=Streptomyces sp. AC495_CC817 TaxID=2823900 RepID=UPI001C26E3FA|nr:hypothetical protein [Streptomyces sp. AC495_CC817]
MTMLLSPLTSVLTGGSVYALALVSAASTQHPAPIINVVALGLVLLTVLACITYGRSASRFRYAMSPLSALILLALIWAGSAIGAVLLSFGEPMLEVRVDPELITAAQGFAQGALWACTGVVSPAVLSAPLLHRSGRPGLAARLLFFASIGVFAVLVVLPAVMGVVVAG